MRPQKGWINTNAPSRPRESALKTTNLSPIAVVVILIGAACVGLASLPGTTAVSNPLSTISVGSAPTALSYSSTGTLYVLNYGTPSVSDVAVSSGTVTNSAILLGSQTIVSDEAIVAAPTSPPTIFVADSGAAEYSYYSSGIAYAPVSTSVTGFPFGLVNDPNGSTVFLSNYCPSTCSSSAWVVFANLATSPSAIAGAGHSVSGLQSAAEMIYDPANGFVYVSAYSTSMSHWAVVALTTNPTTHDPIIVKLISVGFQVNHFAYDPGNQAIYATAVGSNPVSEIANKTYAVTTLTGLMSGAVVGGIAYSLSTNSIWLTDEVHGQVDECSGSLCVVSVNTGSSPEGIVAEPAGGNVYVAINQTSKMDEMDVISPSGTIVASYTGGAHVSQLFGMVTVNGLVFWTSNTTGQVIEYTATLSEGAIASPVGAALSTYSDDLYVISSSGDMSVLNSNNVFVALLALPPGSAGITFDAFDDDIYVTNNVVDKVFVYSSANVMLKAIAIGGAPTAITYDPLTHYVYTSITGANLVSAIIGTAVIASVSVPNAPTNLTVAMPSGWVYVVQSSGANVSAFNGTGTPTIIHVPSHPTRIISGAPQTGGPVSTPVYVISASAQTVTSISPTSRTVIVNVTLFAPPVAITIDAAGFVYLATAADILWVLNAVVLTNLTTPYLPIPLPSAPSAIFVNPQDFSVFLADFASSTVTVLYFASPPYTPPNIEPIFVANVLVDSDPSSLTYNNANGNVYVTCTSGNALDSL